MSESLVVTGSLSRAPAAGVRVDQRVDLRVDLRRRLQLALGAIWLLDGLLQYQPAMFSKAFPSMLADAAAGNPAPVAAPITWSASFIGHHLTISNGAFATIQVLLGLGIAFRRSVKPALAVSVVWALGVWWLGEGLGGVLTGSASPLLGAPGAVLLYAVLAVLVWPGERDANAAFVAGRTLGAGAARVSWVVLWGAMAVLAALPGAVKASHSGIAASAAGQPGWLAWLGTHAASALSSGGLVFAVLIAVIACGVYLPSASAVRVVVGLTVVLAGLIWLVEGFGGMLTGGGTDPDSGPLLVLLALAYWPVTE